MTDNTSVLLVTVENDEDAYGEGLEAIQGLKRGESITQPTTVTFPNVKMLGETFNERTYGLLEAIRDEAPSSIRETARLVDRDKKNVHEELTTLEALGVIRLEDDGHSKRPVFPYDDLVISPFGPGSGNSVATA